MCVSLVLPWEYVCLRGVLLVSCMLHTWGVWSLRMVVCMQGALYAHLLVGVYPVTFEVLL